VAVEVWANDATATVSSGGTDAPAAGTSESWTLSGSTLPAVSSSASPPTQCYVCDALSSAETEKMLVTNISGSTATVIRGADGTTPVTHAAGFTIRTVITRASLETLQCPAWVNVTAPEWGADRLGVNDSSAAFQAAASAVQAAGGGVVYAPFGIYKISTSITKNLDGTAVYFVGDGQWATIVKWYGTGDCFRIYDSTLWSSKTINGGGFLGLTIDGAHATGNSSAFHIGDIFQLKFDVSVQNFTAGTTSKGAWLDNNYNWTEQAEGRIYAQNCSSHVVFDNSVNTSGVASGSFDRMLLNCFIVQQGNGGGAGDGGDGVVFQGGALVANGQLGVYGNFNTSSTQYAVLRITGNNNSLGGTDPGYSSVQQSILNIGVELDDNADLAPYTIYFGTTSSGNYVANSTGFIDFGGSAFTSSNGSNSIFSFFGPVLGDSNLSSNYGFFSETAIFADGTNTVLSAPNITPTFANGTAAQLSDATRDYEVYLQIGTAGTAFSLTMGHTSAASDVTLFSSATPAAGQMLHFRLPASWYVKWAGSSTTIAHQAAVGC
jgi:hypothetical protein